MSERINSPEQLDRKVRIVGKRIWFHLAVLSLGLIFLLVWLFNSRFVLTEDHPCLVLDTVGKRTDLLYQTYQNSFGDSIYFEEDALYRFFGDVMEGYAQSAYLLVPDMENSEMVEGMRVSVSGREGALAFIPLVKTPYETLVSWGLQDQEARAMGLRPGASCYACQVLFPAGESERVLEPGLYPGRTELEILEPKTYILP